MIAALERLIAELATADDVDGLQRAWTSPPAPLAGVEVRGVGEPRPNLATVVFGEGRGPTESELEEAYGPLTEPAASPGGGPLRRGSAKREGMPVSVAVVFSAPDGEATVDRLTLQRGLS